MRIPVKSRLIGGCVGLATVLAICATVSALQARTLQSVLGKNISVPAGKWCDCGAGTDCGSFSPSDILTSTARAYDANVNLVCNAHDMQGSTTSVDCPNAVYVNAILTRSGFFVWDAVHLCDSGWGQTGSGRVTCSKTIQARPDGDAHPADCQTITFSANGALVDP